MTVPRSGSLSLTRECDCPSYISRCAHFEGTYRLWLVLVDDNKAENERRGMAGAKVCPACGRIRTGDGNRSHLYEGERDPGPDCICRVPIRGTKWDFTTDDEALAAFYAAEEHLLAEASR